MDVGAGLAEDGVLLEEELSQLVGANLQRMFGGLGLRGHSGILGYKGVRLRKVEFSN